MNTSIPSIADVKVSGIHIATDTKRHQQQHQHANGGATSPKNMHPATLLTRCRIAPDVILPPVPASFDTGSGYLTYGLQ